MISIILNYISVHCLMPSKQLNIIANPSFFLRQSIAYNLRHLRQVHLTWLQNSVIFILFEIIQQIVSNVDISNRIQKHCAKWSTRNVTKVSSSVCKSRSVLCVCTNCIINSTQRSWKCLNKSWFTYKSFTPKLFQKYMKVIL